MCTIYKNIARRRKHAPKVLRNKHKIKSVQCIIDMILRVVDKLVCCEACTTIEYRHTSTQSAQ